MIPLEPCFIAIHPTVKRQLIKNYGKKFYRSVSMKIYGMREHISGHDIMICNVLFTLDHFEVVGFEDQEDDVYFHINHNQ